MGGREPGGVSEMDARSQSVGKFHSRKLSSVASCVLTGLFLTGCTANYYRKSADRAAYGAINAKTPLVRNMDNNFTLERTNSIALDGFAISTNAPNYLGEGGQREVGARILRLDDALDIAVHHSRDYQNHKEQLYLSALSLALARHQFAPIFSANGEATVSGAGTPVPVTVSNQISHLVTTNVFFTEDRSVSGSGSINVSWLIADVGRVTAAFTSDFLRFVTGDPRVADSSALSATFISPLIRDAGFKREKEALVQSERDLLYALRNFTQYRKDFTVQIARDYYSVLGQRDAARNSFLNYQSSTKNAERTRAMVAEGRDTTANLGRLEQQELSSESSWINAVRGYQQSLDDFKIEVGLPVDEHVILDEQELEALQIEHPQISVDDSIKVALAGRLDYMNAKDEFADTERQVKLDQNLLRPQLDLSASAGMVSNPNRNNGFQLPDPRRYSWSAGLALDPGLDRTSERNTYRSALISRNRAARNLELVEDQIKLDVRNSWRTLDQAERNYQIAESGVKIAKRRVDEQEMLAEVGRARAQDQVDAQNDLISAKNQRTQALVTHTIARLQFWDNMGILYIKGNGRWEEVRNDK
jgi:outer membrane protein TolC